MVVEVAVYRLNLHWEKYLSVGPFFWKRHTLLKFLLFILRKFKYNCKYSVIGSRYILIDFILNLYGFAHNGCGLMRCREKMYFFFCLLISWLIIVNKANVYKKKLVLKCIFIPKHSCNYNCLFANTHIIWSTMHFCQSVV